MWSVCAVQPSERMEVRRMRTLPACCSAPHALHTNPHSLCCTHSSKEDERRIMRLARRPELVTNHIKRFSPSWTAKGMVYILGSLPLWVSQTWVSQTWVETHVTDSYSSQIWGPGSCRLTSRCRGRFLLLNALVKFLTERSDAKSH